MIANAFRVRNKTDYDDFYIVSKAEAQQQLDNAQAFVGFIDDFIADMRYYK